MGWYQLEKPAEKPAEKSIEKPAEKSFERPKQEASPPKKKLLKNPPKLLRQLHAAIKKNRSNADKFILGLDKRRELVCNDFVAAAQRAGFKVTPHAFDEVCSQVGIGTQLP